MRLIADLAMLGWLPLVLVVFALFPPRRAVLIAFFGAWLFLPVRAYTIQGLPDYDKVVATTLVVFVAAMIMDGGRFLRLQPRWFDLPILVFCITPFFTSLSNGLGIYFGVSAMYGKVASYALPYVLGRVYFSDQEGIRDLAVAVAVAGIIYMPLCLFEVRMSPHLHKWIYGYHPSTFKEHKRYDGFRSVVFMRHSLMTGFWMASVTVATLWLWGSGRLKRLWGWPVGLLLAGLLITTVLTKAMYAIGLMFVGVSVFAAVRYLRLKVALVCLVLAAPGYMFLRTVVGWSGQEVVAMVAKISADRAGSMEVRLFSEDKLVDRALERPLLGWARASRSDPFENVRGRYRYVIQEAGWIIIFGNYGLIGLISMTLVYLLPGMLVCVRFSKHDLCRPEHAPVVGLAVVSALFMCDSLMNHMFNPIFVLAAGSVTGWFLRLSHQRLEAVRASGAAESVEKASAHAA